MKKLGSSFNAPLQTKQHVILLFRSDRDPIKISGVLFSNSGLKRTQLMPYSKHAISGLKLNVHFFLLEFEWFAKVLKLSIFTVRIFFLGDKTVMGYPSYSKQLLKYSRYLSTRQKKYFSAFCTRLSLFRMPASLGIRSLSSLNIWECWCIRAVFDDQNSYCNDDKDQKLTVLLL